MKYEIREVPATKRENYEVCTCDGCGKLIRDEVPAMYDGIPKKRKEIIIVMPEKEGEDIKQKQFCSVECAVKFLKGEIEDIEQHLKEEK